MKDKTYQRIRSAVSRALRPGDATPEDIEDMTNVLFCELLPSQPELFDNGNEDKLTSAILWRAPKRWVDWIRKDNRENREPLNHALPIDGSGEGTDYNQEEILDAKVWHDRSRQGRREELMPDHEMRLNVEDLWNKVLPILSENQRKVIVLHIYRGLKIKEVAKILRGSDSKKDQGWVSQQKKRAITKLNDRLSDLFD